MKKIVLPLSDGDARGLSVGDMVLLTGRFVGGRDRFHKFLFHERPRREELPFDMQGTVLYHTGPIIKDGVVIGAGPTTSSRMEMYEPWVIENYGLRGIMGKGGMGQETLDAMGKFGCVYLHTIGGAAVYLAERIKALHGIWKADEFGSAEAVIVLEAGDFPAIVTMDAHGKSLHGEILAASSDKMGELFKERFET